MSKSDKYSNNPSPDNTQSDYTATNMSIGLPKIQDRQVVKKEINGYDYMSTHEPHVPISY